MGSCLVRLFRLISSKRSLLPEQLDNRRQVGLKLGIRARRNLFDNRCVLATLNSNMEVSLWAATKNHLKGEWIKVSCYSHFTITN